MQPVMNPYPLVPKLGTNLLGLSWPPTSNPYHYKAFRLKINRVGKYPTSWSLKKLPKTGVHALSSPCRTTSLLISKESDGWIAYKPREKEDTLSLKPNENGYWIFFLFFLLTFGLLFCFILSFAFLFFFSFLISFPFHFSSFSLLFLVIFSPFFEPPHIRSKGGNCLPISSNYRCGSPFSIFLFLIS